VYSKKTFLAIIPARGGSKRLPNKNILPMMRRPLIEWTIKSSLESQYIDKVIVSSDNKRVLSIAKAMNVDSIVRPKKLSSDNAKTVDVISHGLNNVKGSYDYIVLLQPTSPLRTSANIDESIELLFDKNADSIVSVTKTNHSPTLSNTLPSNNSMKNFFSNKDIKMISNDLNTYYRLNGAIYIIQTKKFILENSFFTDKTFAYHMSQEQSIDIDTAYDFFCAQATMSLRYNKKTQYE
jgi:CMP-N,N'-diacetyllegionaminic acid synthase